MYQGAMVSPTTSPVRWRALLGAGLVALALGGCVTEAECQRRVDAAARRALDDASTCTFAPQSLTEPTCTVNDRRPLLQYYATFCTMADLSCVTGPEGGVDTGTPAACFGEP